MEPAVCFKNEARLFGQPRLRRAAHETMGFLSASFRAPSVRTCTEPAKLNRLDLSVLLDLLDHLFFSFSAPFSRGALKASGACSPGQGLLFAGEPRNFAVRFVSWGNTNPEGVAVATKQKPAVPPARRRFPISPCPRESGTRKGRQDDCGVKATLQGKMAATNPNQAPHSDALRAWLRAIRWCFVKSLGENRWRWIIESGGMSGSRSRNSAPLAG